MQASISPPGGIVPTVPKTVTVAVIVPYALKSVNVACVPNVRTTAPVEGNVPNAVEEGAYVEEYMEETYMD